MITTPRLILRQWQTSDRQHFAEMNADSEVMRYFPAPLTCEQSDKRLDEIIDFMDKHGWGFWAVELQQTGEFIGCVGLNKKPANSGYPQAPLVEIGWRIAKKYWRQGYAYESATACLNYAFNELGLDKVYAVTALINTPSQQLMKKLGMHNTHQDFDHPSIEKRHILAKHCLYKIDRKTYQNQNKEHL